MVEKTPKIENKYTELSDDEKKEEYEKIIASFSDELKDKLIPKKEEKKEVKTETKPVEKSSTTSEKPNAYLKALDDQTELIAQTLMSDKIDEVKTAYKDYDTSGIENDKSINTLQKVGLLTTESLPNARKMATIEKNLKADNPEGTPKDGKTDPKKSPEKPSETKDKDAGKKLLTEMFDKLGYEEETTTKPEEGKKTD